MNKGEYGNGKKERRKIRQVSLSGDEETVVSTRFVDRDPEPAAEPVRERPKEAEREPVTEGFLTATGEPVRHHVQHKKSGAGRVVRGIAIGTTMFFSLLLAMAVGVGLALWDSHRTMADLGAILMGREVSAATQAAAPAGPGAGDGPGIAKEEAAGEPDEAETAEDNEEGSEAGDAGGEEAAEESEEELDPEAQWDEEGEGYGSTLTSDEEGAEGVEEAGSEDEIVDDDEEEDEYEETDPTADYPLPFSTVDESYFTDALFIGDSRLQGFGFWSGLPATYYCATGFQLYKYETANVVQTENGKVPIFEAMPYDAFTKIYIKVGLNELGYGTEENFEKYYAQLIEQLREYEPRAIIYVHGLLPVTAEKSASDKAHNNPNIQTRNAALKKFAESQKAYYLDAGPVLSGEDGSLRPEMTTDGIHLSAQYMKIWREYLCEHAIVIE